MDDKNKDAKEEKTPEKVKEILDLEQSIKNYFDAIQAKKLEMTKQKDMVKDALLNDQTYFNHEEKIKEAKKIAEKTKSQIESTPAVITAKNEAKDLTAEIKEMQKNLSNYLLKYHQLSGQNRIAVHEGEEYDIVEEAKLVKSKRR
ncbi:hypothetical protein A3C23_05610 [Candidatus Roizmanbacteria bacterium RIFCSPHIGHO2_02_FULL_37_13b]|uniref:Uncharacterized protein n=1 Tax=Candidatus Roizmanbacteria bacterium RIFCSPLOWO2_02_FULL_36_11 TaxID=1802071 RepID=A0A1F7JCE4_9BACT|nr:MAG: hypothetical protein A3C23_05610 [Candidatus Roizmanbacteria bacterium RIFCSPHIGHO2_02_FULL_37_13b]OGK53283.1 MAG: hypothetical protein A3H78_03180 [Candidatus Roizmanbacteria bacterium RIFCSPLOWO2_02_FULL_36_11]